MLLVIDCLFLFLSSFLNPLWHPEHPRYLQRCCVKFDLSNYWSYQIKVSKSLKQILKFSFEPKMTWKIWRISALCTVKCLRAKILQIFRVIFGSNENFKICFRDLLTFSISLKLKTLLGSGTRLFISQYTLGVFLNLAHLRKSQWSEILSKWVFSFSCIFCVKNSIF